MTPLRLLRRAMLALPVTLLTLAARVAQAAPEQESGIGFPRDASAFGHRIDWLINVTGAFVLLLFVIMCIWMLVACLKYGKKHVADYDHGDTQHHVVTALVVSSLIFLVVDGNLFYHSVKDVREIFWNFNRAENAPDVVRIEVNAHQWAWDARYAGPDGKFNTADDIVTLNDIRVPIDRPVFIQLGATDVIHSFYLPNFRVKTDAVPGTVNNLWFQAKQLGEYDIACAQHCGMAHYLMKGQLTVLAEQDFLAWTSQASKVSSLGFDPTDSGAHWGWTWQEM